MRKTLFFMLCAAALLSCTKQETKPADITVTIVGRWNYKSERHRVLSATGTVLSDQTDTAIPADEYIVYNANGTGIAYGGGGSVFEFTYSLSNGIETEYQTPHFAGDKPYLFEITLTSTTLTKQKQTSASNQTYIEDDVLTR